MDYLKDKNTFGVNSIFYKDRFVPKFYTVEDTHVLKDNLKKIRSLDYEYQFFPSIYKKYLGKKDSYYYFNMNRGFYEPLSLIMKILDSAMIFLGPFIVVNLLLLLIFK